MVSVPVGTKLHAKFTDGEFYPAEVIVVSDAKKRAKAPFKVHFLGYEEEFDTWMPLKNLKSKQLPKDVVNAKGPKPRNVTKAFGKGPVKLYYWPAAGKASLIRLMLADAGIEWEDVMWEKDGQKSFPVYSGGTEKFVELFGDPNYTKFCEECREKGKSLTNNLPMLEINGKFYTESTAIYKLVARKVGLYPRTIEDAYVVDNIMGLREDAFSLSYKAWFGQSKKEDFINVEIPKNIGNFERLLGDNDYFVPGKLTLADIQVFDLLHFFYKNFVPTVLEAFPKLAAHYERISNRPNIKKWLASDRCAAIDVVPLLT